MATFKSTPTTFKDGWVEQNLSIICEKNHITDKNTIEEIRERIANAYDMHVAHTKVNIVNNYKQLSVQTTLEDVANLLLSQKAILGGDGVLYKQHEATLAGLVPIIIKHQNARTAEKNLMKKHDRGTPEFLFHNRNQTNKKVVINALYGLFGYARFRFFNINLAQSVTAMGQNIISTATCAFEDFLSDNSKFLTFEEIIMYINRIVNEMINIESEFTDEFEVLPEITDEMLVRRIVDRTYQPLTEDQAMYVVGLIRSLTPNQKKVVYYKNNFTEFNNTELVHGLLVNIMDSIECLKLGELSAFDNMEKSGTIATPEAKPLIEYLLRLYDVFVLSTHQIYDRVRRTKYTRKSTVLYIDTDSNFIGFGKFIDYFSSTIPDKFNNESNFVLKCAMIMTIILSYVIKKTYADFTDSLNISEEYGVRLNMKNEFLFSIMIFGLVKKRYIGKMVVQEGKMINGGKGSIEVKGFDFKKAATKKQINDRICDIINSTLLDVKSINVVDVLRACEQFKADIRNDIMSGSNLYYKQLSVAKADKYKNPYSHQGLKGVAIWNVLSENNKIDLPAEVDIIKIKLCKDGYLMGTGVDPNKVSAKGLERWRLFLNDPKAFFSNNENVLRCEGLYTLYTKYPKQFAAIIDSIQSSPKWWASMPSAIAKPRALEELPDWLRELIDIDAIEASVISLINPIMESLGVRTIETKNGPVYSTYVSF